MKKMMKEIIPKLVLAAILGTAAGTGSFLLWTHAHAEDKVNKVVDQAQEMHKIEHRIVDKVNLLHKIAISPNRTNPIVLDSKRQIEKELKDLRNRLRGLKS